MDVEEKMRRSLKTTKVRWKHKNKVWVKVVCIEPKITIKVESTSTKKKVTRDARKFLPTHLELLYAPL